MVKVIHYTKDTDPVCPHCNTPLEYLGFEKFRFDEVDYNCGFVDYKTKCPICDKEFRTTESWQHTGLDTIEEL